MIYLFCIWSPFKNNGASYFFPKVIFAKKKKSLHVYSQMIIDDLSKKQKQKSPLSKNDVGHYFNKMIIWYL